MRSSVRKSEVVEVDGLKHTLAMLDKGLEKFGYKTKYDWISARLYVLRNLTVSIAVIVACLLAGILVWSEIHLNGVQLEPLDVPDALSKQGFTGKIAARRIADNLTKIKISAATTLQVGSVSTKQLGLDSNIKVPIAGISLDSVFSYLRGKFDKLKIVEGEITLVGETASVTVRVKGDPAQTFNGPLNDIDSLLGRASEHIYLSLYPYVLAVYRREKSDLAGAILALQAAERRAHGDELALAYVLWGNILRQQGKGEDALSKYALALEASPASADAHKEYAQTFLGLGRYSDAYRIIDQYIAMHPSEAFGYARKSYLAYLANDFTLSKELALRALAIDPFQPRALANMTAMSEFEHDLEAVRNYSELLVKVPKDRTIENTQLDIPNALARAAMALREFDRARTLANQLVERFPYHFTGYTRMARLLIEERKYEQAVSFARRAMELGPNSIDSPKNLADALLLSGQHEEARAHLDRTLKRLPRAAILHECLGRVLLAEGNLSEANVAFSKAAELAPNLAEPHLGLARVLLAQGDRAGALQHADKAIALAPKWATTFLVAADVKVGGDDTEAISAYQQATKLDPKWGEPYAKWGMLLQAQGDRVGAMQKFQTAYQLEPFSAAYKKLAEESR